MLNIDRQENLIMIFFIVTLFIMGFYVVLDNDIIDIIYLGVVIYYFIKFLIVKFYD